MLTSALSRPVCADILRGHVVEGAQFGKLVSMRNRLKTMNADQTIEARVIRRK